LGRASREVCRRRGKQKGDGGIEEGISVKEAEGTEGQGGKK